MRTFRAAFGEQNSDSDMELYLARAFSRERVEEELADPGNIFLLAHSAARSGARSGAHSGAHSGESVPLGYAKLRPGVPPEPVGGDRPAELHRLYVDTPALGTGLGSALMEACLAQAGAAGHDTLWLGVWERNERAIAFYRRWGFRQVGEHRFVLGNDVQRDLVMARSVATAVD